MNKKVLAIDPGKIKSGIAAAGIAGEKIEVYCKDIVSSEDIISRLRELITGREIDVIIIGNGTFSERIRARVEREFGEEITVEIVREEYTTMEAEERFRQEQSNWLHRFIKWKPSRPLDDYVAVILAERYLEKYK